jgi:uncharacterized protein
MRAKVLALSILVLVIGTRAEEKPNHLAGEQSLYLSRASHQPVDWYPWGRDAFKRAAELNVPILLDVGAVWCPWCGLMDRDVYSRPETAAYLNQHFVAVKVDYDTSPKLVAQLQRAQAVLNLPAGLPLTSFITPQGKLFFGAGYVPAQEKNGKQSFREIADEALARFADTSAIDKESIQLEVEK